MFEYDGGDSRGSDLSSVAPALVERPTGEMSAAVRALLADVEAVAAQVPAELPTAVALADTAALLALGERLRALTLGRLADVDTRRLHQADGAPSAPAWVAAQNTSLGPGEVALARRIATLPCVRSALETGLISVAVAAKVAAALVVVRRFVDRPDALIDGQDGEAVVRAVVLDGVRQLCATALGGLDDSDPRLGALLQQLSQIAELPAGQLARLEGAFVVLAAHLEPAQVPAALARLVDAIIPSLLERKAADRHARRGLSLQRHADGSGWYLSTGELDLETGELLQALLCAEMSVDPDNPVDTDAYRAARADGWTSADGTEGLFGTPTARPPVTTPEQDPDDPLLGSGWCPGPRTLAQRRHDALRNGLRRYLSTGAVGVRGKTAPQLLVTVSLDSLHGAPGSLGPVSATETVLPRSLVRGWWCDSAVTRFVLSLGHKVVETSHSERTLKAHERRAKTLETGGHCQGAGCTRGPGHPLIPHHATPWATSHATSLSDTVLLCEQTHHLLHTGHPVKLKDGRWLTADGWRSAPIF